MCVFFMMGLDGSGRKRVFSGGDQISAAGGKWTFVHQYYRTILVQSFFGSIVLNQFEFGVAGELAWLFGPSLYGHQICFGWGACGLSFCLVILLVAYRLFW